MNMIQSLGQIYGQAAGLLSALSAGTYFDFEGISYQKVTVTGQTPDSGKVFAHRLHDGVVVQLADTLRASVQHAGSYNFVTISDSILGTGLSSAVGTLADVSASKLYDSGSPRVLSRKVTVQDGDGDTIAPGAGKSWTQAMNGSAVAEVDNTTAIESYGASSILAVKVE